MSKAVCMKSGWRSEPYITEEGPMKKTIAMIPARMASTRFPGKPLIDICGRTMIEHVWQRVKMNPRIQSVYIATCDAEIKNVAEDFGAEVIMTSSKHERCTDRIAEACLKLLEMNNRFDVVLNVQGDEPLLKPDVLDLLIEPFIAGDNVQCVNLIEVLDGEENILDRNNVKAIFDQKGFALYFSRLPIPSGLESRHYKQLGAYGLSLDAIVRYQEMDQTPLEIAESDDMLRFIENGIPVKVSISPYKTVGVDTPDDYEKACELMLEDEIYKRYP